MKNKFEVKELEWYASR